MEGPIQNIEPIKTNSEKAIEFVEKHRDFFENYVKGKINFAPAPKGLDTFAFDLNTNTIYISTRFMEDHNLSFKDEASIFAVLHECEHFLEKVSLLGEENGEYVFQDFLRKIKDGAYDFMDNCIADMRENFAVVSKVSPFTDLVPKVYRENLWVSRDFTKDPLHLQFIKTLAREFQVKGEDCSISVEVREEINKIRDIKSKNGISLIDIMANPDVPMSQRIRLQDQYIWPVVQRLRKKDIENKNNGGVNNQNKGGGGGGAGIDEDGKEGSDGQSDENKKKRKGKDGDGKGDKPKETDPNIIFKDEYDKAGKEGMPKAVPLDSLEKAFKDWQKENGKEAKLDKALQEYADKIGVKKEDLKTYQNIIKTLENSINKETGRSIREELIEIIERIISHRKKPKQHPRYPLEEGDYLVDPVGAVVGVSGGNLKPAVWEDIERREVRGQMFGEIEITLVCDRSGSMKEPLSKLIEQRKSLVFLIEAIKTLNTRFDEEEDFLLKPIKIKIEGYSFQKTENDKKPFLEMTDYITEKISIDAMSKVSTTEGFTTDFITLEAIKNSLSAETKEKIKEGELKKIVIVFTDGESDNKEKVQEELKSLKESGVIVIGVGITESGAPALETYAPDARLAKVAEDLTSVLFELLKEHLKGV